MDDKIELMIFYFKKDWTKPIEKNYPFNILKSQF